MIPDDGAGHDTDSGGDRVTMTDMVTDYPADHTTGNGRQA